MLLGCNVVGEVHITRKQYLDGSIPTGFQRTAIIGTDGDIPFRRAHASTSASCRIEEDSCREVSDRGHVRTYRTDRLGMPLIEIGDRPGHADARPRPCRWARSSAGCAGPAAWCAPAAAPRART